MALFFPVLAYAQPSLRFTNEAFDFGTVKQGEKMEHVFEFENTGTDDLNITSVHAS